MSAQVYNFPKIILRCKNAEDIEAQMNTIPRNTIRWVTCVRVEGMWVVTIMQHIEMSRTGMQIAVENMRREYI